MKKLLIAFKLGISLSVSVLLVGTMGCKSEYNVDQLQLDPNLIINYGEDFTASAEAVVYGQLMPGSGQERTTQVFNSETKDMSRCIMRMKDLVNDYDFDTTQDANFKAWTDGFQNKLSLISPDIQKARQSTSAARSLAGVMEAEVKTLGALELRLRDGRTFVPDSAKGEFDKIAKDCADSYNRVYQTSLVLAQTIAQKESLDSLRNVVTKLEKLETNAETRVLFPSEAQALIGQMAVKVALSKAQATRIFVDGMTKKGKIAAGLNSAVGDLKLALNKVTTDYVNNTDVAVRPEAKELADEAITAANALETTATLYRAGVEDLKDTKTDTKLDALTTAAFSGNLSVLLGDLSIDRETDVNALSRQLGSSPIVVMKQDASSLPLVEALASAVVHGVASSYGLPDANNVWGLRSDVLIKAKSDFSMSQDDYTKYSKSRAKKAREMLATDGNVKNVYVVYADALATEGADVSGMIDELAADKGKVLVVTTEPTRYESKGRPFSVGEMDLAAAVLVGTAILQKYDLPVPAQTVSEQVVRLVAGLKGSLRIGDLGPVMKDAALQVSSLRSPTSVDVTNRVMTALAAHNVPLSFTNNSKLLSDSLSQMRENLAGNRGYYVQAGQNAGDLALRTREAEENRKTGEAIKKFEAAQAENQARQTKTTQLKIAYDGYQNDLDGVVSAIDLFDLVNVYKGDIDSARRKALDVLASMNTLLDSDFCVFRGNDEVNPGQGYDGGYLEFLDRVSKQQFSENELRNPMATLLVGGNVVLPAVGPGPVRAAIGMNCALPGPGRGDANDGRFTLKNKVISVRTNLTELAQDALDLATNIRTRNLAVLQPELKKLSERLLEDPAGTGIAVNPSYWKRHISKRTARIVGGPDYGMDFDVESHVVALPHNNANPQLLPPQYLDIFNRDLPSNLFAVYAMGIGNTNQKVVHDEYSARALMLPMNTWTYSRVYGYARQIGALPTFAPIGTLNLPAAVGAAAPLWYPNADEFLKMHRRIWAWHLSRIVGKITNGIPHHADLYAVQAGVDYFDDEHVFIKKVFKLTEDFVQKANRDVIAEKALLALREYKQMAELLYSLPKADYEAFLNAPATPLSTYFKRMETIMTNHVNVNSILNDTRVNMTNNWFNEFFHNEIITLLPAGTIAGAGAPGGNVAAGFSPAIPVAGENNRLATIWPALLASATRIRNLQHEISVRIAFVNP